MSYGSNTAQTADQADDNTGRTQLDIYAKAAARVVQTIGARDDTHGDPRVFAVIFADMLSAYLRPRLAGASFISEVDALVVLDLMKTARLATGGEYTDHVLDKAGYAILALAAVTEDDPIVFERSSGDVFADLGVEKPEPARPLDVQGEAATDQDDDNADLIRWALDPASDPLADLAYPDGSPRPGITPEAVQGRREHLSRLLLDYVPAPGEEAALTTARTRYCLPALTA